MRSLIGENNNGRRKIINNEVICNSMEMAEYFGKQHSHVLRSIKEAINELEDIANSRSPKMDSQTLIKKYFKDSKYTDKRGKEYSRYYVTFKGFNLVGLAFRGKKAFAHRANFLDAFEKMLKMVDENKETARLNKLIPFMIKMREEGKKCRKELVDSILKFDVPLDTNETRDESVFLRLRIISYTKMINKLLNIKTSQGVAARDILEGRELLRLEDVELKASRLIEKHHTDKDMTYQKLYQRVKVKLEEYCE